MGVESWDFAEKVLENPAQPKVKPCEAWGAVGSPPRVYQVLGDVGREWCFFCFQPMRQAPQAILAHCGVLQQPKCLSTIEHREAEKVEGALQGTGSASRCKPSRILSLVSAECCRMRSEVAFPLGSSSSASGMASSCLPSALLLVSFFPYVHI